MSTVLAQLELCFGSMLPVYELACSENCLCSTCQATLLLNLAGRGITYRTSAALSVPGTGCLRSIRDLNITDNRQ